MTVHKVSTSKLVQHMYPWQQKKYSWKVHMCSKQIILKRCCIQIYECEWHMIAHSKKNILKGQDFIRKYGKFAAKFVLTLILNFLLSSFHCLKDQLDYEVDSDDEWEDPGESLSDSGVSHKVIQEIQNDTTHCSTQLPLVTPSHLFTPFHLITSLPFPNPLPPPAFTRYPFTPPLPPLPRILRWPT